MAKRKKKKLKLKKRVLFQAISLGITFFSLVVFVMFVRLDVLPFSILMLILGGLLFCDFLCYFFLTRKNYRIRFVGTIFSFLLCFFFLFCLHYQNATLHFLKEISFLNIETENYEVLVLKEKSYQSLSELSSLGYVNDRKGVTKAWKEIQKSSSFKDKIFEENSDLVASLLQEEVDAILLEEGEAQLYLEMSPEFKEKSLVLTTISVEVQNEMVQKNIAITKEPFHVYVTGIDTYGKINKVSRSDVNMVITVNPLSHKILLTSIPRDYYVPIYGSESTLNDKLTHAGLKGVETSMKTIDQLLDIEIPYFVKINFTSLIDIIDAVEGVDVDNPFAFTANYQEEDGSFVYYKFAKGNIHLNGKEALAYVRERYGLREGDVARARHQQQVISALALKATGSTLLTKYTTLLGSLEGNFTTNFSLSSISDFVEMQLSERPSWTIETQVLTGIDSSSKTASFPDAYSSVLLPDEDSVNEAITKIKEVMAK